MKNEPIYQLISENIRNEISSGLYKPGEKLKTEVEIAKQYDVSRVTARKSLNILVTEGLIERFAGKGTFIKNNQQNLPSQKTFAVILPAISPFFGSQLLYSISHKLQQENITLIYAGTEDNQYDEANVIKQVINSNVDGLIIWPAPGKFIGSEILQLILADYPIVLLDRYIQDAEANYVSTDNIKSTRLALEYLIKLGHKSIAIVSKRIGFDSSIKDRILAAQIFLNEKNIFGGLLDIPKYNKENIEDLKRIKKEFTVQLKNFIKLNPKVTSFFVTDYFPASLLYDCLIDLNYDIPNDFSIICFDSPRLYLEHAVRFTHLEQNESALAEASVEILLNTIGEKKARLKKLINADLIIGDTTKKIKEI
ncbi:GntR family transcriptional regulator [Dellaglioa algida]|uniref:GntR family transcriptional regulator n=1 Tax=Dellaglioa algida TaxID=105612 RepID=UPI0024C4B826|nr:GntR family transcriptional regulator [Dellaglioa algida]MDK1726107.1 GntR family transcriptional regulator [Dellaglioa algida]